MRFLLNSSETWKSLLRGSPADIEWEDAARMVVGFWTGSGKERLGERGGIFTTSISVPSATAANLFPNLSSLSRIR